MLPFRQVLASLCLFLATTAALRAQAEYWTKDTAFAPAVADYDGRPGGVYDMARQADGKYIITGQFTKLGTTPIPLTSRLARLNANGSLDSSFSVSFGAEDSPERPTVLASGKILVFGAFASPGGVVSAVARFNSNGSRDSTYGIVENFYPLVVDSQGSVYGQASTGNFPLQRLTPDGAVDPTFVFAESASVDVTPLSDGALLISYSVNGGGTLRYIRARHDGSADPSFQLPTSLGTIIKKIIPLPDGRALAVGRETDSYRFTRFKPTGEIDYVYACSDSYALDFQAAEVLLDLLREAGGTSLDPAFVNVPPYPMAITSTGEFLGKFHYPERHYRTSLVSPSFDPLPHIRTQPVFTSITVKPGESQGIAVRMHGPGTVHFAIIQGWYAGGWGENRL